MGGRKRADWQRARIIGYHVIGAWVVAWIALRLRGESVASVFTSVIPVTLALLVGAVAIYRAAMKLEDWVYRRKRQKARMRHAAARAAKPA